ncbi:hypothetical protein FRC04_003228 [Tulasnella sp. 424]|nr:hypothetical protein FRC04_003228 [Tulasnella sp. 424]KAG8966155.1 hypothetical protein FRC05_002779 [Tulasnella sp. 425]
MPPKPASPSVVDLVSKTLLESIKSENSATVALELSPDEGVTNEVLRDALKMEAAVSETIELLKQRLDESVAEVRRHHNALLPVQQLPPEILSTIVIYELEGIESHNHLHRLIQLSSVSRWWNAVIVGRPSLWTEIHSANKSEVIALALERSKDSPLTVLINSSTSVSWINLTERYIYSMPEDKFLDLVCPHMGRWRDAKVQWLRCSDTIQRLSSEGPEVSPHLECLHVNQNKYPTVEDPIFCFPGRAERLLDLKLEYLAISTDDLIKVLAASPQLVSLELLSLIEGAVPNTEPSGSNHSPDNAVTPTYLPHLVTVKLLRLPSRIMVPILDNIRAPNVENITILHDTNVQSNVIEDPNMPDTGPFTTFVSRLLEATPSIYVNLKSSGLHLKGLSETTRHYEIELNGVHSILLRWLRLRCLPQLTTGYHVHLDFDSDFVQDESDDVVTDTLMRLSRLKSVRLRTHPEAWRWVWLLSLPDAMPAGSAHSWLWPELAQLTVDAGVINEVAILSMLLGRFGLPSAGPMKDGPSPLRLLKVHSGGHGWRTEVVERIKGIVGEECFVWE